MDWCAGDQAWFAMLVAACSSLIWPQDGLALMRHACHGQSGHSSWSIEHAAIDAANVPYASLTASNNRIVTHILPGTRSQRSTLLLLAWGGCRIAPYGCRPPVNSAHSLPHCVGCKLRASVHLLVAVMRRSRWRTWPGAHRRLQSSSAAAGTPTRSAARQRWRLVVRRPVIKWLVVQTEGFVGD
jgi:hypothetical protein